MDVTSLTSHASDASRLAVPLLATWVLFAVFVFSALAFVLKLFGLLHPDGATQAYLFGVFSISAMSLFIGLPTKFLQLDPAPLLSAANVQGQREQAAATVQQLSASTPRPTATGNVLVDAMAGSGASAQRLVKPITLFTQIASDADRGRFVQMKALLPPAYIVPGVETVGAGIPQSQIRYCDPLNKADAEILSALLASKQFGAFTPQQIARCDQAKNANILEVWIQGSA